MQNLKCQGMLGAGLPKKCKQRLVESYNLTSYVNPRGLNMWLCPSIEQSCCSLYDQFTMFQLWNKEVKKRMVEHFEGIREKVEKVGQMTLVVMKQDLKKLIKKLKMKKNAKRRAMIKVDFIKRKKPYKYLNIAYKVQPSNAHYMQKVRSAFYCVLCDFRNHHFFKLDKQVFIMNKGSCATIAENTINFTYLLHVKIAPALLLLAKVLRLFEPNPGALLKINHFKKVRKATRSCAQSFISSKGGNNGSACKQYCTYFNINNTSAVQEGYEVFFNDIMNTFEKFFRHMNIDWKKGSERLLQSEYKKNKRILESVKNNILTQDDFLNIKDPYKQGVVHPEYNDHTISTMFNFQKGYEVDRHAGYRNFAKNSMYYFDAGVNYSEAMPKELYRTSPSKVVKLDEFSTEVRINGASVAKHASTTNINNPMKDLILHLKLKTRFKIFYEKLDPTMLNQINGIVNKDVIHFHRDFFMKFDNFSVELKRQEAVLLEEQKEKEKPIPKEPEPEKEEGEEEKEEEKKQKEEKQKIEQKEQQKKEKEQEQAQQQGDVPPAEGGQEGGQEGEQKEGEQGGENKQAEGAEAPKGDNTQTTSETTQAEQQDPQGNPKQETQTNQNESPKQEGEQEPPKN